ncbi:DNA gyrase inhibitor YacG [Aquicella siphonis]|uniref:DNA gyrase inhibitor YacG n=1 Tax=Aquicella siphonis TaxID=254247 RepID=A0A5E4PFE3_9COXI|nr:DNA gyrase inhibitor YacG [Aquicella siphonis]VVC75335.1 DNA gyrase inhibitor YacG [Aquicella siphonis]
MTIEKKDIVCPTCGKKGTWTQENKFRPFCSDRCKLMDLGDWADEKHRVPGEPVDLHELPDDKQDE